jgi:hypothetical protein
LLTAVVMCGVHCVVSCVVSASIMSLSLHACGAVIVTNRFNSNGSNSNGTADRDDGSKDIEAVISNT